MTATGAHGAGDATLPELITANILGELDTVAAGLQADAEALARAHPRHAASVHAHATTLRKIAAGIRQQNSTSPAPDPVAQAITALAQLSRIDAEKLAAALELPPGHVGRLVVHAAAEVES